MIGFGRRATIAIALSCFKTSYSLFNINALPSQQLRTKHGVRCRSVGIGPVTRLQLFGSILQNQDHKKSSNRSTLTARIGVKKLVPDAELDFMRGGFGLETNSTRASTIAPPPHPPFPYSVDINTNRKSSADNFWVDKLVIRHLEEQDILRIMPEIVREFGSLAQPQIQNLQLSKQLVTSSSASMKAQGDEVATLIENFLFSFTVLFGLTQRVARRKKGYSSSSTSDRQCRPDHNVICLVEQRLVRGNDDSMNCSKNNNNNSNISTSNFYGINEGPGQHNDVEGGNFLSLYIEEEIVGIAELSWQPPIPNRNAPPYVLPYFIKMLLSRLFSPPSAGTNTTIGPKGYISNVLVWKNRRGRGYSRVLMAALEGIAKLWGCADVRLHVDANEQSGNIAQQLYGSLGYEGVPDRGTSKRNRVGYEWMGPNMAHEGLYMVDGLPLLYLRKYL